LSEGFEGECAEVRAVRGTEGKNDSEGTLHKEGAPPAAFDILIIPV